MGSQWLYSIKANATEQKVAIMIAFVAALTTAVSLMWLLFFDAPQKNALHQTLTYPIHVIKKPNAVLTQTKQQTLLEGQSRVIKKIMSSPVQKQMNTGRGKFYVQVGAFKHPHLARLTSEKMKKKYQHVKIVSRSGNSAVWVGPVVSKTDARSLKKNIQRRNNINGFIVIEK